MHKVMAVTNQKGGPGKTSAAVNVTIELAHLGFKTVLVDIDPQANATKVISAGEYNHEITSAEVLSKTPPPIQSAVKQSPHHPNAFYIPSSLRLMTSLDLLMTRSYRESVLKKQLDKLTGYDFIIIDTQPNAQIGTVNAMVAADYFLIPIDGGFSLDGLSDLLALVEEYKAGDQYRKFIFKNKYSSVKKVMGRFIDQELAPYHADVLDSVIRIDEALEQANTSAVPIRTYKASSRAATDYKALAKELLEKCNDNV